MVVSGSAAPGCALEFRGAGFAPLRELSVAAPGGAVIGVVGDAESGASVLLHLAAGLLKPAQGEVSGPAARRYFGPCDVVSLDAVGLLAIDNSLAQLDAFERAKTVAGFDELRRRGAVILLRSQDRATLETACDEIWWLEDGVLAHRGDPRETLDLYAARVAERLRAWGETRQGPLRPALRKGDGRAQIVGIETAGASGRPSMVWNSGEAVTVRVRVRYEQAVDNPVLGLMIRTRIGLEVYGTNTELERVKFGPVAAGDVIEAAFRFRCDLCPGEYTLTAASHDPDGTAHDWMDDAVAFLVADNRYTAGVANLRAAVSVTLRRE